MGRLAASAACFTGLAASCCPRPLGRSGCVRTPTTECAVPRSARRAGTEKSGVPANAMRRETVANSVGGHSESLSGGGGRLFRSLFLAVLVELLANALALQVRQVIDEELAFEVIHLVLHTDGEDVVAVALEHVALPVQRPHPDFRGPHDFVEDARHRQATLFQRTHPFLRQDLG